MCCTTGSCVCVRECVSMHAALLLWKPLGARGSRCWRRSREAWGSLMLIQCASCKGLFVLKQNCLLQTRTPSSRAAMPCNALACDVNMGMLLRCEVHACVAARGRLHQTS